MTVEMIAARPGVFSLLAVSSLTATAVSQPQEMNSITMMPLMNAEKPDCSGLNQEADGVIDSGGWCPVPTRTSATTESSSSMTISMLSSTRWNLAGTSLPRGQMYV